MLIELISVSPKDISIKYLRANAIHYW